jgi:carbon monoxide dehydrogenase subunit G
MRIDTDFEMAAAPDVVWTLLTDIERIAPCIPGFQLQEIEGDEYRGQMALKIGAVSARYACRITFVSLDEAEHIAVFKVSGKETAGQGGVEAEVRASLAGAPTGTRGSLVAEVAVSGRLARFGRNLLSDVSGRLTAQFVRCLESRFVGAAAA